MKNFVWTQWSNQQSLLKIIKNEVYKKLCKLCAFKWSEVFYRLCLGFNVHCMSIAGYPLRAAIKFMQICGQFSNPGLMKDIVICSWTIYLTLTVALSTQLFKLHSQTSPYAHLLVQTVYFLLTKFSYISYKKLLNMHQTLTLIDTKTRTCQNVSFQNLHLQMQIKKYSALSGDLKLLTETCICCCYCGWCILNQIRYWLTLLESYYSHKEYSLNFRALAERCTETCYTIKNTYDTLSSITNWKGLQRLTLAGL